MRKFIYLHGTLLCSYVTDEMVKDVNLKYVVKYNNLIAITNIVWQFATIKTTIEE
ncbi:unnamed protein product, partial [Nesidiocoris tenuis]